MNVESAGPRPKLPNTSDNVNNTDRLLWVIPLTVAAATMANVIFYFILTRWLGEPLLMIDQFPPPEMVPMAVSEVILFSILWSLAASVVYAVLTAATTRPERRFVIISAIVLVLSFALPLKAPTPPVAMSAKLSLAIMHVIGAIVVVSLLVGLGRKRP